MSILDHYAQEEQLSTIRRLQTDNARLHTRAETAEAVTLACVLVIALAALYRWLA